MSSKKYFAVFHGIFNCCKNPIQLTFKDIFKKATILGPTFKKISFSPQICYMRSRIRMKRPQEQFISSFQPHFL